MTDKGQVPTAKPQASQSTSTNQTQTSSTQPSIKSTPTQSREGSPGRLSPRSSTQNSTAGTRSRKNSHHERSPARPARSSTTTTSSSTKSLSSSTTPTLMPASTQSSTSDASPQKLPSSTEQQREAPRWPISPRLRSPPPVLGRPAGARKGDNDTTMPAPQRAGMTNVMAGDGIQSDPESDDPLLHSGTRTPARGASSILETVQESPMGSPQILHDALDRIGRDSASETSTVLGLASALPAKTLKSKLASSATMESAPDASSAKPERRNLAASIPPPLTSRQSSTSAKNVKTRPEASTQAMTVETETVDSIPQVAVGPLSKDGPGTLRTRPSSETIRPKKDKKKSTRKVTAVPTGTASSRADIFEAKIASAVDEADTSDSDETFVYDSNPPDAADRPRRFHSRTPSTTSMGSQVDRNGMRSLNSVLESGPALGVKKSMKFVNTFNSSGNDSGLGDDETKGAGRSSTRSNARAHHHNIGRAGRHGGGGNGHTSLFDNDAPFASAAQRSRLSKDRQPSDAVSARSGNHGRSTVINKRGLHMSSYDFDDTTTVADDERTPLITSTIRSSRSSNTRRQPIQLRHVEAQDFRHRPTMLTRCAGCLVLAVMALLVISGAVGFMFATTQPLQELELVSIRNVLASEEELMFDITVKAHNPNLVVVMIDSADIEVFAKSPFAGDGSEWWRRPRPGSDDPLLVLGLGKWEEPEKQEIETMLQGEAPDETAPNMRLGSIRSLDSPLSFEGSFFNHGLSISTGEVRLQLPGNSTESGSRRWERILQDEFDLIVKGVLKYSLPLSQRVKSVPVSGRKTVKPNAADKPALRPNETEVGIN